MTSHPEADVPGGESQRPASDNTRKYAAKRDAILRSAVELFNDRGVKGTGLKDVAHSVGLATNSVTYYYRKKEDLAVACYLRAIAIHDDIFRQAACEQTLSGRVKTCLDLYFEFHRMIIAGKRDPIIFFDDIRTLSEEHSAPAFEAYTAMFRSARQLLWTGKHTGKLDRASRTALNACTHLLLSVLLWVPAWMHRYEPEDFSRLASRIHDILMNGLAGAGSQWHLPAAPAVVVEGDAEEGETSAQAFLRAASELINEHGYLGASVDRISARLNVTKGSFYHHNDNKDNLVVDCFEHTFEVVRQAQNAADLGEENGWTKLCNVSASLVRYQMSPQGPLLRTTALHAVPEPIRQQMALRMNRLSDRFANFIIDGMAEGSVRIVDPVVAGQMINPMINGGSDLARWAPDISPCEALDHYVRPLFIGLQELEADAPEG